MGRGRSRVCVLCSDSHARPSFSVVGPRLRRHGSHARVRRHGPARRPDGFSALSGVPYACAPAPPPPTARRRDVERLDATCMFSTSECVDTPGAPPAPRQVTHNQGKAVGPISSRDFVDVGMLQVATVACPPPPFLPLSQPHWSCHQTRFHRRSTTAGSSMAK